MFKYVLAGLFILILSALLQHPVPILEGVEVYSERSLPEENIEKTNPIDEEIEIYSPQANIKTPNSEPTDYHLFQSKSPLVSVSLNTY